MTDAQKVERLRQSLRLIQKWALCDDGSPETREQAMDDIYRCAQRALEAVE